MDVEIGKLGFVKLYLDDRLNVKNTKGEYFLFNSLDFEDYTVDSNNDVDGEPIGIFYDNKYKLFNSDCNKIYCDDDYFFGGGFWDKRIHGTIIKAEEGMSKNLVCYQIVTMVDDKKNTYEGYYYPIEKPLEVGQSGYMKINSEKFKERNYRGLFIVDE